MATAFSLKEGDLVRLRSGGPLMTVTEVSSGLGSAVVYATWFDDNNELRSGFFPPSALAKQEG